MIFITWNPWKGDERVQALGQIENSIILFEEPQSTWLSWDHHIFVIIGFNILEKIILIIRSKHSRKTRNVSYEELVLCSSQGNLRVSNLSI